MNYMNFIKLMTRCFKENVNKKKWLSNDVQENKNDIVDKFLNVFFAIILYILTYYRQILEFIIIIIY